MAFCRAAVVAFLACRASELPEDVCSGDCQEDAARGKHEFALITDLDKASRHPSKQTWHAWFRRGALRFETGAGRYHLDWLHTSKLESSLSFKNRSMELSELVRFQEHLLAMCDITGLVFEVDPEEGQAFQRLALADGNGRSMKPFKAEWATVKDGYLFVGSMGREWTDDDGSVVHRDAQWVKRIDSNWHVQSLDWGQRFEALRAAVDAKLPGYLWHEAIIWDEWLARWLVLPRKESREPYSPTADETRGTNLLLLANDDFSVIETLRIGPLEPEWGFAAIRKVPGTNDTFAALKVREVGKRTATKLCVFDLSGRMLLEPIFEDVSEMKFEGMQFT